MALPSELRKVLERPPVEFSVNEGATKAGNVDIQQILWKLDTRLLPLLTLLFILSFLDRTNIGNAKVAGLTSDLNLTGLQYNLCAAMFFVTACLFEVPSNIALKIFGPSRWIPFIAFTWACVVISMAFVKDFAGLLVTRVVLGMTEAGMFPGLAFYVCTWYPRASQAKRITIVTGSATISGAFGGILAYGIEKMNGIGGLAGWSWIFLVEGLVTAVVALFGFYAMHDSTVQCPENASFLTESERIWLVETIRKDSICLSKTLHKKFLWQAFQDPHAYLMVAIFFSVFIPGLGYSLFLPTVINGLGYSAANAQLLCVPPNAVGCLISIIYGVLSDRYHMRGPFVLASAIAALFGYVVLFVTSTPGAGYAGLMIAACGVFSGVGCTVAWVGTNFAGETKKAVVIAMVIGLGNLGGIVSSFIYRPQDSPRYRLGHTVVISSLAIGIVLTTAAMVEFSRQNRRKIAQCARERITEDDMSDFVEMGDASPLFRYMI